MLNNVMTTIQFQHQLMVVLKESLTMDGHAQEAYPMSVISAGMELLNLEKAVMMGFLITKDVKMIVWEPFMVGNVLKIQHTKVFVRLTVEISI